MEVYQKETDLQKERHKRLKKIFTMKKIAKLYKEQNPENDTPKADDKKGSVYIEFLNKDKNFQQDRKYFDSYSEARKWAIENFDSFDQDMIHYAYFN